MKTRVPTAAGGLLLAVLALCVVPGRVHADEGADPPSRVARLSDAEGAVSLQPAGMQDWTAAIPNRPLTTGDHLWSDQNSRAELDMGAAAVRLGSNTGFGFLNLDDRSVQMQLATGTLIVRVRDMQAGESYELDTPNVALSLQQPGEYRAEVNERGDLTVIKVSDGAALAAGADGQQVAVSPQEQLTVSGTDRLAYDAAGLGAPDDFDDWSAARERQLEDATSAEYVASDIPGTQDLDDNGQWQETPEYGYAWIPTAIPVGWVPYRDGHWVWIAPWGWTWVDDSSWGFAPFHYGRWGQCNGRWCWVPGSPAVRPVYAPALVAWAGGAALGGSTAYGTNVGWFPLGPREVYVPAYPATAAYVRAANAASTRGLSNTYITNVYQNRITPTHYANNRAAALTAVSPGVLTSGQAVSTHAVAISTALLAGALVTAVAPPIAPIRQSVLGPAESHGAIKPPAALLNKPVVARSVPPRAPVSFDAQLAAIQGNGGHALGGAELAQLPRVPATRVRVVTPTGGAVAASTLPHHPSPARAAVTAARSAPASQSSETGAQPTLAEREHALQESRLPPAAHPNIGAATQAAAAAYQSQPQTGRGGGEDGLRSATPRAHGQPASIPVYHPPTATQTHVATPKPRTDEGTSRDAARAPASAPVAHPQQQAHPPPAKESPGARAPRELPERPTK